MPELDTTIDRSAETLERLMAALVAAGTAKMDPTGGQAILLLFCARQEPARDGRCRSPLPAAAVAADGETGVEDLRVPAAGEELRRLGVRLAGAPAAAGARNGTGAVAASLFCRVDICSSFAASCARSDSS